MFGVSGTGWTPWHLADLLTHGALSLQSSHEICVLCRASLLTFRKLLIGRIILYQGLCLLPPPPNSSPTDWGWGWEWGLGGKAWGLAWSGWSLPLAGTPCQLLENPHPVCLPYQPGGRLRELVFYDPIMCEILPIRERLSTQNIDFKTHFLLRDYE